MDDALRFPIGHFEPPATIDRTHREQWIHEIAGCPARVRKAVRSLDDTQLDTPYRPKGWTPRQVVHHLPESHMNCYVRFKLALTEDNPTIRPYDEARWAELADVRPGLLEPTLVLLEAVHAKLVLLLESMTDEQFQRTFYHPEREDITSLEWNTGFYAWHCRHHEAHITSLREREGW